MEPVDASGSVSAASVQRQPWLRRAGTWAVPLLLGAIPSTAWIMSSLLPVIGPVAWGEELLALGATPVVIAVLDISCADWRQWRESRRSFSVARHVVALGLAVLGTVSAVNLAPAVALGGTSTVTFSLFWMFLLAFTTATCAAFITSGGERA